MAILAVCTALVLSLVLCACGVKPGFSFLFGFLVVPVFVLVAEFAFPYSGGGASMWPVALMFGSIYGTVASSAGVLAGRFIQNRRSAN